MKYRFVAVILLVVMLWLEASTLSITAATPDEPMHMIRGDAFMRLGKDQIASCSPCSPVLAGALIGSGLSLEPDLQLPPKDDPAWTDGKGFPLQEAFLWRNTAPPERMIFLARLPIMAVSLLLAALIFRWSSQRSGPGAALGTLVLYVFGVNILAHARLATTDVVATATFALSAYTFTRALDSSRRILWIASGVALGLALAAKISAVWLPVAFFLLMVIRVWQTRHDRRAWLKPIGLLMGTGVLSLLTLWAIYRFTIEPLTPGGISVIAPAYWREWLAFNEYLKDPLPSYLFGQMSKFGWWYYFPITFAVKTSLPELIFLGLALLHTARARTWVRDLPLILPPLLLFGSLLFSPHDLGYRYLLPIVPFIFVYSADVIRAAQRVRWTRIAVLVLIGWQIIGTLRYYPYYLTFFNEIVGGPDRGRYIIVDSNLDWGQDLIGLKQYVDEHVRFSYSGATLPSVYGLHTEALPPVYPPMRDQGVWWLHTLYPPDPLPGTYALALTSMMADPNSYSFFRDRAPDHVIGNSIYIYDIPPQGPSVDVALSGLQVDQIDAETFKHFGTNDVRLRWFDATTSLIAAPDRSWVAIADNQAITPDLAGLFDGVESAAHAKLVYGDQSYRLYQFDLGARLQSAAQQASQNAAWSSQAYPAPAATNAISLPVKFGQTAELLGYELKKMDGGLTLVTYWRAGDQVVTPLQLFAHVIGPAGSIVAQEDRLDAPAFGWHAGDLIAQVNHLHFGAPLQQPGWLEIGLYHSDSGERLPVMVNGQPVDSRLLLQRVEIR